MNIKKITVGLDETQGPYNRVVSLYLGNDFAINIREGDRYLYDSIRDGACNVGVPEWACNLFVKYGLYKITQEANPEVIGVLKKVFLNRNTNDFEECERQIGQRTVLKAMELKLSKDRTIVALIDDPEFRSLCKERLNESIKVDRKSEKLDQSAKNRALAKIYRKKMLRVAAKSHKVAAQAHKVSTKVHAGVVRGHKIPTRTHKTAVKK
jgi:hypothetical protein